MLVSGPVYRCAGTYKIPTAKTPMSASFCMRGSCSCDSRGIGITSKVTSVRMFMEALKNQSPLKLRQWPGIEGSQNFATGTQFR